jgi:competence ComEA-like helix-hairpin-helix protein
MKFIQSLKEIFDFNSTERNGSLVLILVSIVILLIPQVYERVKQPDPALSSAFTRDILAFEAGLSDDSVKSENRKISEEPDLKVNDLPCAALFSFDPNGLSVEKWKRLGLQDWQIKVIKNYEAKGGRFYKKEDLAKIYGIQEELFRRLEPYITIRTPYTYKAAINAKPAVTVKMVDINVADTNMLMELRGIGPSFARRIVKYREKLGGFYSVDQLLEVYGFDPQRLDQVKNQCTVGKGPYRLIQINKSGTKELKMHPYFDYSIAKVLVDERIQRGGFKSSAEVESIVGIPGDLLQKIIPYLDFEM